MFFLKWPCLIKDSVLFFCRMLHLLDLCGYVFILLFTLFLHWAGPIPGISPQLRVVSTSLMDSSQTFWLEYVKLQHIKTQYYWLTHDMLRFTYRKGLWFSSLHYTVTFFPCGHQVIHVVLLWHFMNVLFPISHPSNGFNVNW